MRLHTYSLYLGVSLSLAFTSTPNPTQVRSISQMRDLVDAIATGAVAGWESAGEQLVDARPAGRFRGADPEPRPGLRGGHMPGARSLPFPQVSMGSFGKN
jgi:thiosulfate/3-mercaptopyruvate sulfurtransferase